VTEKHHNSLKGKVALVTGAAHRLGAQTVRTLHHAGMDVILHYRSSGTEALTLMEELVAERPGSVFPLQADLSDLSSLPTLVEQVHSWRGRLDVLVNNASTFYPTAVGETSEAQWNDLMGSNLKAPFFLAQALAPMLQESEGVIVNMVDIHAERPLKDHPVYSMAKAANGMMVKALARELGPKVRVNGVAAGAILWPENGLSDADKDEILSRTALNRAGNPQDIARTILFLIRDAHYTTGQILAVDGGRTAQH
jgi:pteridine reductase